MFVKRTAAILFACVWASSFWCSGAEKYDPEKLYAIPGHYKISVEFDKPKFFLGEQILAHYCVENTGDTAFTVETGGDYRGVRAIRFRVLAKGEGGKTLDDPYPSPDCGGGMMGPTVIAPSKKHYFSTPLHRYISIDKPGKYSVTIAHDLKWVKEESQYGLRGPDWNTLKPVAATAQIECVMPDEKEAERIADEILARSENYECDRETGKRAAYRDITSLNQPIYLAVLAKRAEAGNKEALVAIGEIATTNATRTLLDLSGRPDKSIARIAMNGLKERLPWPWRTPAQTAEIKEKHPRSRNSRLSDSWLPIMAPQARENAKKLLLSDKKEEVDTAAFVLQSIGIEEDAPSIIKALDIAISLSQSALPAQFFFPGECGSCAGLVRTAEALVKQDIKLPDEPQTPGEIALFLLKLKSQAAFRPQNHEALSLKWLSHPMPYIRAMTLQNMPRPISTNAAKLLPGLILDKDPYVQCAACGLAKEIKLPECKESLIKCLAMATDRWVRQSATEALSAGADNFEVMQALLEGMDEKNPTEAMGILSDYTLKKQGGYGSGTLDPKAYAGLKDRWLKFIKDYEARFRKGERFELGDLHLDAALFPGMEFSLKDGGQWPPKKADDK